MANYVGEAERLDSDDAKFFSANSEFLMKKYAGFYNSLIKTLQKPIGTLVKSPFDEATFQLEHGNNWVLCDGQDITGSDYANLTGKTNAPDMVTKYHYVSQSSDVDVVGIESDYEVSAHRHFIHRQEVGGTATNTASGTNAINRTLYGELSYASELVWGGVDTPEPTLGTTETTTAQSSRPNTVTINYFLRVSND